MDELTAARVAREMIRAYQRAIDDQVSPPLDEAEGWDRESVLAGVRAVRGGATPDELHELWREHRTAAGWTPGPAKDVAGRRHPNLVPRDELPADQRLKDDLFAAVVGLLAVA